MFQKALEEVLKQYPSTHQPATLYKIWLTQLMQDLLIQYEIEESRPLALLLVNILEGMTIQAQVEHGSVKIDDYVESYYLTSKQKKAIADAKRYKKNYTLKTGMNTKKKCQSITIVPKKIQPDIHSAWLFNPITK